jgi:hypothetical protein
MQRFYQVIFGCCLLLATAVPVQANDTTYTQRQQAYIDTALAHFSPDAITLQAYRGVPVDQPTLNNILVNLPTNGTADFSIVQLVRILYFGNGAYDTIILPVLDSIPFWINKGDLVRDYWSENHMCQWISSDWLLHERYGKPVDPDLHYRVVHYLQLKVQFGFYEFFSTVYGPYCLSGLLNLADFSQDAEIKSLATQASQKLLTYLLMNTNNEGVCFPTAGRNYYAKYETAYGQNHNNLIYLLTGMGPNPGGASHAGGFLASSTLPVDSVINSWTAHLDTSFIIGHTLDTGFIINDSLAWAEKIAFQWSSGAYFHPEVAEETGQLLTDSDMWDQVDFAQFLFFSYFPTSELPSIATQLTCASESSVLCQDSVIIYKNNAITLSSVKDFWKGKAGYEEFPCVANVGTTAVYTITGSPGVNFTSDGSQNENNDLPYVSQVKNIALLMYRPEANLPTAGFNKPTVVLHWQTALFDEIRNDSLWILGRQANSYVGVRRYTIDTASGNMICPVDSGQSWVIIVGDSTMYGSFDNFQSIIDHSQFSDRWYLDTTVQPWQYVYYAQIIIDSTNINYAWGVDSVLPTSISNVSSKPAFNIFPNPAGNQVTLDLSAFLNQPVSICATDVLGREVYSSSEESLSSPNKNIYIANWAGGVYMLTVKSGEQLLSVKLVKKE